MEPWFDENGDMFDICILCGCAVLAEDYKCWDRDGRCAHQRCVEW